MQITMTFPAETIQYIKGQNEYNVLDLVHKSGTRYGQMAFRVGYFGGNLWEYGNSKPLEGGEWIVLIDGEIKIMTDKEFQEHKV